MRALLAAIAVLIISAGTSTMVSCQEETDLFSANVSGIPATSNLWNYTVANTSASDTYTIFCVMLEVDEDTDIINAPPPTEWVSDLELPHMVTWFCNGTDIMAGHALSDFKVEFSAAPQFQSWSAMFNNSENPAECPTAGGSVLPVSVPEPSSLASIIAGLASGAAFWKRRRA